jgi:hypothetical protein
MQWLMLSRRDDITERMKELEAEDAAKRDGLLSRLMRLFNSKSRR